nr:hypothetical protein 26 [Burkholderiaceae bacterium]
MDFQVLFNIILVSLLSLIGWFCNELWTNIKSLQNKLHKHEVDNATNYARKDELELRFDKLEEMLNRIFDKLEKKADK